MPEEDIKTTPADEPAAAVDPSAAGESSPPDETPVPKALHRKGSVVLDMVYDPLETRLLREAQDAGCVIVDGLEMLLMQATAQFETWTSQEAPLDVMRAAAVYLAQEPLPHAGTWGKQAE